MLSLLLTDAAQATGSGANIEIVYYVIASVIAIGGVAIGGARVMMWLRGRWTREGEQRAAATAVIEENTKAAQANTVAIGDLSGKLDRFADNVHADLATVHAELNGHGQRIHRLEVHQGITAHALDGGN